MRDATPATARLVYLARLREAFGAAAETLSLPHGAADTTVEALLDALRRRGGVWATELAPGRAFRVAVNHEMASLGTAVRAGDEVAIFPPVTGG
jgi:molybdopterin synthase sulfur carrier subunit